MLVQKGYESDPVAAWTRAQEKVLIQRLNTHKHMAPTCLETQTLKVCRPEVLLSWRQLDVAASDSVTSLCLIKVLSFEHF